jgi:hypothetical protein
MASFESFFKSLKVYSGIDETVSNLNGNYNLLKQSALVLDVSGPRHLEPWLLFS